jgi:hypothetical protein
LVVGSTLGRSVGITEGRLEGFTVGSVDGAVEGACVILSIQSPFKGLLSLVSTNSPSLTINEDHPLSMKLW